MGLRVLRFKGSQDTRDYGVWTLWWYQKSRRFGVQGVSGYHGLMGLKVIVIVLNFKHKIQNKMYDGSAKNKTQKKI